MEDLYTQGKVKALGVTNYSVRHLKQLLKVCRVKPMINQVEFHPRLVQTELLEFCKKEGIVVQAYASLGSGDAGQAESFFSFPPVGAGEGMSRRPEVHQGVEDCRKRRDLRLQAYGCGG